MRDERWQRPPTKKVDPHLRGPHHRKCRYSMRAFRYRRDMPVWKERLGMFERFTDRARRVVVLAQEEARMHSHNYIGTEHLLLGLIHEGEGVAAKALEKLGISLQAARDQVDELIGAGQNAPSGHIPFTPRAKRCLELSLREALQLGDNFIGTEHLLLGLIREGDGVASRVLMELGADAAGVRQQVIALCGAKRDAVATSDAPANLSDQIAQLSEDRIWLASRKAAAAIASLPSSQQLEALSRAQRVVMSGLIAEEVRLARDADVAISETAEDPDEATPPADPDGAA